MMHLVSYVDCCVCSKPFHYSDLPMCSHYNPTQRLIIRSCIKITGIS